MYIQERTKPFQQEEQEYLIQKFEIIKGSQEGNVQTPQ